MKKILIYGDSNLWGYDFSKNKRLEDKYQWANMLDEHLKSNYKVLQEGLPGRIAGNYEEDCFKNGKDTFETIFKSCSPVDYVIIALGTNDLQIGYQRSAEDIYKDLIWYKNKITEIYEIPKYRTRFFNDSFPEIIYLLPGNFDYERDAKELLNEDSEKERRKLIEIFENNSENKFIKLNDIDLIENDGMHYSIKGQEKVFNEVKKIFE